METKLNRTFILAMVAMTALGLLTQLPVTQAQVSGPHAIWWNAGVWNNRYPGSNVRVTLYITNSALTNQTDTIESINVTTPWQTYSASDVPAALCQGCTYVHQFNFTIPSSEAPGDVNFTSRFTGSYGSGGGPLCPSTGNICSEIVPVTIDSSPSSLQQANTTYSTVYLPLAAIIPSLVVILFAVLYVRKGRAC